jgi:hypothetical protein
MTEFEREVSIALKCVVSTFLGFNKQPDSVTVVANTLLIFKTLRFFMGL